MGLGAALLLAGCGGSSGHPVKVPAASLARAADASAAAAGYKIAMTMRVTADNQSAEMHAVGSFSTATHEAAITETVPVSTSPEMGTVEIQEVLADGTIYLDVPQVLMAPALANKIPGGKPWLSVNLRQLGTAAGVPGLGVLIDGSSTASNPTEYLDYLRATTSGTIQDLGRETVNGVPTTHYYAVVDFSKLPNTVPAASRAAMRQLVATMEKRAGVTQEPIDVWIDRSDLVRRLKTSVNETVGGQSVAIVITENFLGYGPQPAPTVPIAEQTVNLLTLLHH